MEIVSEDLQRCLAYFALVSGSGYSPTEMELEQFSRQPGRHPATTTDDQRGNSWLAPVADTSTPHGVSHEETVGQLFVRLGWAEWSGDRLLATPLAVALDRGLRTRDAELPDAVDVVLDRADPMASATLFRRIHEIGPGLLVDPSFTFEQVVPVLRHTRITRVLTSERISAAERKALEMTLAAATPDRPFEVRIGERGIHDRNVVGDDRSVLSIGTSLDAAGAGTSVVVPIHDGAAAIADHYEEAWRTASPVMVAPSVDLPPPAPADDGAA